MGEKYQSREERRKQRNQSKGKRKKSKSIFMRIFLALVILGILGLVAGAATFAYMVKDAPKFDEKQLKDPISSEIFDKDGKLVAEIGAEKRDYVEYDEIPKHVEEAILATEDVRFYKHNGIDFIRLGGAVLANIRDGYGSEGGSTITQQVIKMSFLTPEKTLKRKVQEAWLSFQLERKYSKEEIFEMYVNKVWMNSGGHGIATAAKTFYGKELDELTIDEAALLAGMPQSPANYDPFKHPDRAKKRRNVVLSLMYKHGYITKDEYDKAKAVDVESTLLPEDERKSDEIPYDSFIGQVIREIQKKYPDINPFSDGLKIYTTLDTAAQDYVDKLLNGNEIIQFPNEKFQSGITVLDTKTGEILALGGGRNQENVTFGFNYATDAKRQPGSTIKPILDYGPAIEYLKWGTYQPLEDKPYTYSNGQPINNWDNKHMGVMTMRRALALSRNIPALQALQAVGLDKAKEFAIGLGIPLKNIHEAYAIGGFGEEDKGVSSLELAGAYSAFGNNGIYTEPHAVTEIILRDGTKLNMKPKSEVAMQDYTAFMITDMLKSVVQSGTGTRANIPGLPVAGKTGTTNYPREDKLRYNIPSGAVPDAWFVGYTTNFTIAVWTGYDNKNKNYLIGNDQKLAQHIFKNIMQHVSKDVRTADFAMPNSVEKVRIVKGTTKLASEYTPNDQVVIEYAVKGHAPTEVATEFDILKPPSGFKANYDEATNEVILSWNYDGADDVFFELSVSKNGGQTLPLTSTQEKQYRFKAEYGAVYTFKLVAVRGESKSDPVTIQFEVPDPFKEEEPNEEPSDDNEPMIPPPEDQPNGDNTSEDEEEQVEPDNKNANTSPTSNRNTKNNQDKQNGNKNGNQNGSHNGNQQQKPKQQ